MRRIFGCLLISVFLFPVWAEAENLKIGYVDLQRALNESEAGRKAKEAFKGEMTRMETKLERNKNEVQRLGQELEKKMTILRDEERDSLERDYRQKLRDFERLYKDSQQELKIKDRDLTGRILEELREIILDIGQQGSYTVILEGNNTVVLYGAKTIDLTEQVIQTYNQRGSKVSFRGGGRSADVN